jgi:hypothetical protein
MQRPPPRSRGGASRIPRPQGSLGDLRTSLGHGGGELARSHDSGISRSASLVSLASMAASRTHAAVTRRRAVSRPDVLDEDMGRGVAACFDRTSSRDECTAEEHFLVHLECRHALEVAKVL